MGLARETNDMYNSGINDVASYCINLKVGQSSLNSKQLTKEHTYIPEVVKYYVD